MSRPWHLRLGHFLFSSAVFAVWLAACGGEPEPTAGTISGGVAYSGTWPESGTIVLSLFRLAPWSLEYVPGAPAAFKYFQAGMQNPISFSFDDPPIAFGTYATLLVAWKDPDDNDHRTGMHPLSIHGTTLDRREDAAAITLGPSHHDEKGILMPAMVLYSSATEMRAHYPSL